MPDTPSEPRSPGRYYIQLTDHNGSRIIDRGQAHPLSAEEGLTYTTALRRIDWLQTHQPANYTPVPAPIDTTPKH
jgi:hypothetical protein